MVAAKEQSNAARQSAIAAFIKKSGWDSAKQSSIAGDASSRSYKRLETSRSTAILMNAPPAAETSFCPPNADEKARIALGYNAEARLAGPNLHAFVKIAETLSTAGLSAPAIYAYDAELGAALIEDLGDCLFVNAVSAGIDETLLYENAVDVLSALHSIAPTPPNAVEYKMMTYDTTAMLAEVALIPDWYWPHLKKEPAPYDLKIEYKTLWRNALDCLAPPSAIVLRDYHAENLLWLPERDGVQKVGLIDFQDGLIGSPAYDLVSVLEDARRDVPVDLAAKMVDRYCANASATKKFDENQFRTEFAILGAQRNAKILGIFARLINRDKKPRYADFLPRVENHFRNNLKHPALANIKKFFDKHFPDLTL